jgi:hypothetical protein
MAKKIKVLDNVSGVEQIINVSSLASNGTITGTDLMLIEQSNTLKKVSITDLSAEFDSTPLLDNDSIQYNISNEISIKLNASTSLSYDTNGLKINHNTNQFTEIANVLNLNENYRTKSFTASIYGTGETLNFTINHGFATKDVVVEIWEVASKQQVFVNVEVTDTNNITIKFDVTPELLSEYRVIILGRA